MTIRKTPTPAVLTANAENGRRGGGPKTAEGKQRVRDNAIKHGLLAKRLIFADDLEKAEFDALVDELEKENHPQGVLERMLLEEIGTLWWKLQIAQAWELDEIRNRREASKSTIRRLIDESGQTDFPLFQSGTESAPAAAELRWDCNELLVRSSSTEDTQEGYLEMQDKKSGRLEFAAKLTSSMDTMLRYQTGLKRDFYRAIRAFKELQTSQVG